MSGRTRETPTVVWNVKLANLIPCVRCIGVLTYKYLQAKQTEKNLTWYLQIMDSTEQFDI